MEPFTNKTKKIWVVGFLLFLLFMPLYFASGAHAVSNASVGYVGNSPSSLEDVRISVTGASNSNANGTYVYSRSGAAGVNSDFNQVYRFNHEDYDGSNQRFYIEVNQLDVSEGQLKYHRRGLVQDEDRGSFSVSQSSIMRGVVGQTYMHPSEYTFRYFGPGDDVFGDEQRAGIVADINDGVTPDSVRKPDRVTFVFRGERGVTSVVFGFPNARYVIRVPDPCESPGSGQLLRNFGTGDVGAGPQESIPITISGSTEPLESLYPDDFDCEYDPTEERLVELQVTIINGEQDECYGPYIYYVRSRGPNPSATPEASGVTSTLCVQSSTETYTLLPNAEITGLGPGDWQITFPELPDGNNREDFSIGEEQQRTFVEFEISQALAPTRDEVSGSGENDVNSCEDIGGNPFSWAVCKMLDVLGSVLTFIDGQVDRLLRLDEERYKKNDQVRNAWTAARNIAYMLLVPAMLVMVIGTALGFEFVSAYTVKKALPRMVAAAIFITFSLDIATLVIDIINAIGVGAKGIITNAMNAPDELVAYFRPSDAATVSGAVLLGGIIWVKTSGIATLPAFIWTLVSFLLVVAIVLFIAYAVLVLRQVLIVGLLLLAPLAIIGWIFPANTRLWTIWRTTFVKLLLMYPLIMLVLGVGRGLAAIVSPVVGGGSATGDGVFEGTVLTPIFILLAYTLPYVFIPFAFKFVGGTIGRLGGMLNNVEGGWLKKASSKGRKAREIGRSPKENDWQRRMQDSANRTQLRRWDNRNQRNAAVRGAIKDGDTSDLGKYASGRISQLNPKQAFSEARQRRIDDREATAAVLKTEVAKSAPSTRSGYALKQASEIEVQAQTIQAQQLYENIQNAQIEAGNYSGARGAGIKGVRENLQEKLAAGTATDAEVAGTMQFLGTQKSAKDVHELEDFIADLDGEAKVKAAQQWQTAFGNGGVYSSVVGISPGSKAPIASNSDEMKQARAVSLASEPAALIAGAKPEALIEAVEQSGGAHAEKVYSKLAEAYASGGEIRANIKLDENSNNPREREILNEVRSRAGVPPTGGA